MHNVNILAKKKPFFLRFPFILFILLLIQHVAIGQEIGREVPEVNGKKNYGTSLNNHRFVASSRVFDPFITTSLRNSLGAGQSVGLNIPILELENREINALQGQLMFAELEFDYRFAMKDWLAFWFNIDVYGRLGTKTMSFLASGINTAFSFELGWLMRLYHNKQNLLSGTVTMYNQSYMNLNVMRFIDGVINDDPDEYNFGLATNTPSFRIGLGLRYAYAINEIFGVQAMFEIQLGEPIDRSSEDIFSSQIGMSGDMNLQHWLDVPIGIVLSYNQYSFEKINENVLTIPREITLGVAYMGREDYSIGLDIINYWYKSKRIDTRLRFVTAMLTLLYYF